MIVALGGASEWKQWSSDAGEVYLLQAVLDSAKVRTKADVQDIASAGARAAQGFGFDLRGVALGEVSEERFEVSWAFTTKMAVYFVPGLAPSMEEVEKRLEKFLQPRFPFNDVQSLGWKVIDDDDPAVDFWRYQPVLWDTPIKWYRPVNFETPVPTDSWARFEGLFQGDPLSGHGLKPWPEDDPLFPPGEEGDKSDSTLWWVLGFGALLGFAYHQSQKQGAFGK